MAQLVQGLRCEKPRPSTCQVKASVQPSPWQAAGPHNSYLSRLNALYSGISDQKAQPCTLVYETLPPEPHPLCPRRPCEPHLRQGSSGQALQTEEGQGHGLGPLTHNLILFQIDVLQRRQGGELLGEVVELLAVALPESVKLSTGFTALSNIMLLLFGAKQEVLIVVLHPAYHHCGCKSEAYKWPANTLHANNRFLITITHLMIRNKKLMSKLIFNDNLITQLTVTDFFYNCKVDGKLFFLMYL